MEIPTRDIDDYHRISLSLIEQLHKSRGGQYYTVDGERLIVKEGC